MSEYIYGTDGHEGHWLTGEEIVRCKDCIEYSTDELGGFCTFLDFQDAAGMENMYCAWGMRKGDAE